MATKINKINKTKKRNTSEEMSFKATDEDLKRILASVKASEDAAKESRMLFNTFREWLFKSMINDNQSQALNEQSKPNTQANITEVYHAKLMGEFAKQQMGVYIAPYEGEQMPQQKIDMLNDHTRAILADANDEDGTSYNVHGDMLSGGIGVYETKIVYLNNRSFDQKAVLEHVENPTMCGFDPLCKKSHAGDGRYCYKRYTMYVDEFQRKYPEISLDKIKYATQSAGSDDDDFTQNWYYENEIGRKIIVVCEFYEKEFKQNKIFLLANGQVVKEDEYEEFLENWNSIEMPPEPVDERVESESFVINRFVLIKDKILDSKRTLFRELPLSRAVGQYIKLFAKTNKYSLLMRPAYYNAKGPQDLCNTAIINAQNELARISQQTWMMPIESIPKGKEESYTKPTKPSLVTYHMFHPLNPDKMLNKPEVINRQPIPPEIGQMISLSTTLLQNVLGSFDPGMVTNDNPLSGVAIVEGASQANAAAKPFIFGHSKALNQAMKGIVKLFPSLYTRPRILKMMNEKNKPYSAPIDPLNGMGFDYDENALHVRVTADVSFEVEKNRALQQIMQLQQVNPGLQPFFAAPDGGMQYILKNISIQGAEDIQDVAMAWFKQQAQVQAQQQQAAMQNDPKMVDAKYKMLDLQHRINQDQIDNQFRAAELANDQQQNQIDQTDLILKAHQAGMSNIVALKKAQTEENVHAIDAAVSLGDQQHRHALETVELAHNIHQDNLANKQAEIDSKNNESASSEPKKRGRGRPKKPSYY